MSSKLDENDRFDEFYRQYPRKEAKAEARKAWRQVTRDVDPQIIIDGLAAFAFKPDRQFQPLPASWLRGRRWEDETSALPMYDVNKIPEPGAGWSVEQLDMVLGKDTWQIPDPPAGLSDDEAHLWQQQQRRHHFAQRVRAALEAIGRSA